MRTKNGPTSPLDLGDEDILGHVPVDGDFRALVADAEGRGALVELHHDV